MSSGRPASLMLNMLRNSGLSARRSWCRWPGRSPGWAERSRGRGRSKSRSSVSTASCRDVHPGSSGQRTGRVLTSIPTIRPNSGGRSAAAVPMIASPTASCRRISSPNRPNIRANGGLQARRAVCLRPLDQLGRQLLAQLSALIAAPAADPPGQTAEGERAQLGTGKLLAPPGQIGGHLAAEAASDLAVSRRSARRTAPAAAQAPGRHSAGGDRAADLPGRPRSEEPSSSGEARRAAAGDGTARTGSDTSGPAAPGSGRTAAHRTGW